MVDQVIAKLMFSLSLHSCTGEGGRKGFVFVPACFITSETFLKRLTNEAVLKADAPLLSVLPDRGNHI